MRIDVTHTAPVGDQRAGCHPARREFSPRVSALRVGAIAFVLLMLVVASSLAPRLIAFAQQPSFEVATIKPGDPSDKRTFVGVRRGGQFFTINATAKMLMSFAYAVQRHQISGGPGWLDSDKFSIEAKPDGAVPAPRGAEGEAQYRLMARSLLAERFKLVAHSETREGPIYELVVGRGGPKFKESAENGQTGPRGVGLRGLGHLTSTFSPLDMFASTLSAMLGRSVIDKTGLKGKYDFTLEWTPDPGQAGLGPQGPEPPVPADAAEGPSLFTAIQEELGLRLESAKGPVEVIVIDHVEKPSEN